MSIPRFNQYFCLFLLLILTMLHKTYSFHSLLTQLTSSRFLIPRSHISRSLSNSNKIMRIAAATTTIAQSADNNNPIFSDIQPFSELLANYPTIIPILKQQNFHQATTIQTKAIPKILAGMDVVIGAETGSGKTLSYMLPLILKYGLETNTIRTDPTASTITSIDDVVAPAASVDHRKRGLILAPTNELCDQIKHMTNFLFTNLNPTNIVLDRRADSFFDWLSSTEKLHITLCTPKAVADAVRHSDHFSAEHPFRALDFLVLDEADMLMEGSYARDVEAILDKLRLVRRSLIQEKQLLVHAKKTQFVLAAATIPTYGVKSTRNLIKQTFPHAVEVRTENLHQHHPSIAQEFIPISEEVFLTEQHVQLIVQKIAEIGAKKKDKNQNKKNNDNSDLSKTPTNTELKQQHEALNVSPSHIAQLPFSTMVFLNTAAHAHTLCRLFQQQGYQCTTEVHSLLSKEQREHNLRAFRNNRNANNNPIDTNNMDNHNMDKNSDIYVHTHAENSSTMNNEVSASPNSMFSSHDNHNKNNKNDDHNSHMNGNHNVNILVCTDACARGLDIAHVHVVVQGEFALNVVQHLHRIGRASRGGRQGVAINCYTAQSQLLVDSITAVPANTESATSSDNINNNNNNNNGDYNSNNSGNSSIEKSFSRKRGFRQKFKKSRKDANPLKV